MGRTGPPEHKSTLSPHGHLPYEAGLRGQGKPRRPDGRGRRAAPESRAQTAETDLFLMAHA